MTSVSEDVFPPSPIPNTHLQLNGNGELGHSASMENIASIHDNIFYKTFGKPGRSHGGSSTSRSAFPEEDRPGRDHNLSRSSSIENEDIEYRPVSGFVNRLLGRFSNRDLIGDTPGNDTTSSVSLSKKCASLENIASADNNEASFSKRKISREEPAISNAQKQNVIMSSTSLSHRARSIENLDAPSNRNKSSPLAVSLRHVENKWETEKTLKSPRESHAHVIAPDVELARDDIIIIENTPPVPALQLDQDDNASDKPETLPIHSYREEMLPEELPKPNTVLNVRSLFETVASGSAAVSSLLPRRHRTSTSETSTDRKQRSRSVDTTLSSRTPRPSPSPSSLLSPRIITPTNEAGTADPFKFAGAAAASRQPSSSSSQSSKMDEGRSSLSSSSSTAASSSSLPTSYSTPASSALRDSSTPCDDRDTTSLNNQSAAAASSSSTTSEQKPLSVHERGSLFFDSRPSPSPRSTASVKPTMASKSPTPSPANIKPIPLPSAPASAATSYKKSSPVAPVAPFKKTEENNDDGTPVLIYQKQSPKRQTTNNRSQVNGKQFDTDSGVILLKNTSSSGRESETNNKFASQQKNKNDNFDSTDGSKKTKPTVDIYKTNRDEKKNVSTSSDDRPIITSLASDASTISVTKEKTVINLSRSSNDKDVKNGKSATPGGLPVRPPRNKNNDSAKTRPAPMPPKPVETKEEEDTTKKPSSMIYISSSDNSESDASTPPQTPRTRPLVAPIAPVVTPKPPVVTPKAPETESVVVAPPVREKEESQDPPIKGIPSIMLNRMKQNQSARDISNATQNSSGADGGLSAVKLRKPSDSPSASSTVGKKEDDDTKRDSNPIEIQLNAMRKKMEHRSKANTGATQIFDSSQLAKKRKERKEAAAKAAAVAAAASQGMVPSLDLSNLNDNRSMNVRRKEIKPCNITFVGENAKTSRNLLKKQRDGKTNIQFKTTISATYEYPSEDCALQAYLAAHPNEPETIDDDILVLDNVGFGESSDDVEDEEEGEEVTTPRGERKEEDDGFKSTPGISSTSNLQSYRGRFQQEFEFGSHRHEPEPIVTRPDPEPVDPDSMMLRPAEEETVDMWSTNSSSDLLF